MRHLLAALHDLALPPRCAGCGEIGAALCARCRLSVRGQTLEHWPQTVVPDPTPAGFPSTWAASGFEGGLRSLISAHKDEGRRDLTPFLGGLLASSVRCALAGSPARGVVLVPLPGGGAGRRTRGDRPGESLAAQALTLLPGRHRAITVPALTRARRVLDQSHLGTAERMANQAGSMRVENRYGAVLSGRIVVLTDDVVTTGATLAEAARALATVSDASILAAVIAATRRWTSPDAPRG